MLWLSDIYLWTCKTLIAVWVVLHNICVSIIPKLRIILNDNISCPMDMAQLPLWQYCTLVSIKTGTVIMLPNRDCETYSMHKICVHSTGIHLTTLKIKWLLITMHYVTIAITCNRWLGLEIHLKKVVERALHHFREEAWHVTPQFVLDMLNYTRN